MVVEEEGALEIYLKHSSHNNVDTREGSSQVNSRGLSYWDIISIFASFQEVSRPHPHVATADGLEGPLPIPPASYLNPSMWACESGRPWQLTNCG